MKLGPIIVQETKEEDLLQSMVGRGSKRDLRLGFPRVGRLPKVYPTAAAGT